jgi:oxalate decarboxylase/phosphoglucose isomerase-like protein (cupin superfamily)
VLSPDVFSTSWNHVDHVIIPAGKSAGPRQLEGIEEVYYVMKGSGKLTVGSSTFPIKADDSFPVRLGENMTISNDGTDELELLVIGISVSNNKNLNANRPLAKPKAMVLQMDFIISKKIVKPSRKCITRFMCRL